MAMFVCLFFCSVLRFLPPYNAEDNTRISPPSTTGAGKLFFLFFLAVVWLFLVLCCFLFCVFVWFGVPCWQLESDGSMDYVSVRACLTEKSMPILHLIHTFATCN